MNVKRFSGDSGGDTLEDLDTEGLYRRYGPMVLRRCRQLLGDEDAALDAMQDVFARLLDQKHPQPEFPSSFLYTMATRICIDKLRSAAVRYGGNEDLLHTIASTEDIEERAFARRFLDRIFQRQEESTRVMAVLHYVDGMTFDEVAEQMALSAAGVRRRLEKLKARVAKMKGTGREASVSPPAGKETR
jgi:RNA polymerase sigma-70 factor, ECF subfamily